MRPTLPHRPEDHKTYSRVVGNVPGSFQRERGAPAETPDSPAATLRQHRNPRPPDETGHAITALFDDLRQLAADLQRLHTGVAHWSPSRWSGRTADGRTRADVVFALICDLATLGERAGCGAPPGATPRRLGAHALPDQFVVVAGELLQAPRATEVVPEAAAALASTRRALDLL